MLSCAMLMPRRSSRSLVAHLIRVIVARKSAMMVGERVVGGGSAMARAAGA